MSRQLPSLFSAVVGNLLYNEFKNLGSEVVKRSRKRFANYILGPPSYYNYSRNRPRDLSLMRIRSVRRRSTAARLSRGRLRKRAYRRRRYKRTRGRGRARSAMGTNGPAFRSRMNQYKNRVELGQRMGFMPSRRVGYNASSSVDKDKTLIATRLVKVPYSDTDNIMNCRTGRLCDVIGVKFRAWFELKSQLVETDVIWENPIMIRWAIINPTDNTGLASDITAGQNFFVSTSPGEDDTYDFPTTGNCFTYMNRKINMRKYGVLQEGTFLLSNDPASTNTRVNVQSKKFISFYVPIKRQMKWGNNAIADENAYPNANVSFVWWYCKMGDKDPAQVFSASQPMNYTYEHITYFRNADILD